ncbi:MAG: rhodanese-like domain-containing protein, partial [Hyphomicrobiales bacterium]
MFAYIRVAFVWLVSAMGAGVVLLAPQAMAGDVRITPDTERAEFTVGSSSYVIERNQDKNNTITGTFAKTSRACPPFCIHPMKAAEGVETVGEIEVIEFLKNKVSGGSGLLVDARIPKWHKKGTIPGAINIPFTLFSKKNPYLDDLLPALGAKRAGEGPWQFSEARELLLFCNGPWCDQSPRAIRGLLAIGYPADKLLYYRGGMQNWSLLG